MESPHADEVLMLADGRRLAWAEWGDPRGVPLVFFHPWPGSRMLCPDPAATMAAGVRLITVDRPGYGRSDPVADPTLAGFARDLERLLDHLWVGEIPLVGWSGGGQYAAASAALLAERVRAVALVATPAPDSQLHWLTPDLREVAELATTRLPPGAKQGLTDMWNEALRTGAGGLAADVEAGSRPWGFAPSEVRARTALFYGQNDPVIHPGHGRWWVGALPRAELTILPGSDHFLPFDAWADILRAVA
jgi:pimeloyl-ACP methyl ester carboxylesterase